MYDEKTGFVERQHVTGGIGPEIRRAKGAPPPCRTSEGCVKGTPEDQRDLTPQNVQALFHFRQCETTGIWPDDSRVLRNAGIIASARERAKESQAWTDKLILNLKLDTLAMTLGGSIKLRSLS